MDHILIDYREVINCNSSSIAVETKTALEKAQEGGYFGRAFKYACITSGKDGQSLSVAVANNKGPVLGETVVAASQVAEGAWVGLMAGVMYLVRWSNGLVVEESILEGKPALTAPLFYTDLNEEDRAGYFGNEETTLLELSTPAMLEPIKVQLRKFEKRKLVRNSSIALALLLAGISGYTLWPRTDKSTAEVVVAELPLTAYQEEFKTASPAEVLHILQQAAWRAQTMEGWHLSKLSYTSKKGIQLEMVSPQPKQQAITDWKGSQPFSVSSGGSDNNILLHWAPSIPKRELPKEIRAGEQGRVEMLDEATALGLPYKEEFNRKANQYETVRWTITIPAQQEQVFSVLMWLFRKHPESRIERISFTHNAGQWAGTVVSTLIIGKPEGKGT